MPVKIYVGNGHGVIPFQDYEDKDELLERILTSESYERGVLPFDVMEARGKVCFKMDAHLARFIQILGKCQITMPMGEDGLAYYVQEALADAQMPEAKVRIDVVIGEERSREALAVMIKVSPFLKPRSLTLITAEYTRHLPNMKLAGDYAFSQIMKRRHYGVDDILYVDPRTKRISEASRANFFAVEYLGAHSRIYGLKSSNNILPGITRQAVKDMLKDGKNRNLAASIIEAGELSIGDLGEMDEVFMTSSGIRVTPVARINDLTWEIGHDQLGGRVTRELAAAFNNYLEEYYKRHAMH
jgi:branched-subunit amino acid aminotransferase/4-amino-4-deoxychorismate lyase